MAERHYKREKIRRMSLEKNQASGKSFRTCFNIRKAFQRWRHRRGKAWKQKARLRCFCPICESL